MRIRSALSLITACLLVLSCSGSLNREDNNERLWYTYPAKYWNSQTLHLGNGYFGASFFGSPDEILAISEKSMWTGGPAEGNWEKTGSAGTGRDLSLQ